MNILKNCVGYKTRDTIKTTMAHLTLSAGLMSAIATSAEKALAHEEIEGHIEFGPTYNLSENAGGAYLHTAFIFLGDHEGPHAGLGPGFGFHCGNQSPSVNFELQDPQQLLVCEGHLGGGVEIAYGFQPKSYITIAPFLEMGLNVGMLWHGNGLVGSTNYGDQMLAKETQQFFPLTELRAGVGWQYKSFGIVTSVTVETPLIKIKDGINGPGLTPAPSLNIKASVNLGFLIEI